ncbi:MAG: zinc ribbon domain-containing protein [Candidatus Omnitrophica bacterium]|nr:zinc ribbon domain-containing protein [Candidatus Omnitrophota bacterium]
MALIACPECGGSISDQALSCPRCGHPIKKDDAMAHPYMRQWRGFEWRSKSELFGLPLIHIAFGRNKKTGRLLVAKGIIAIGQFAIGLVTFAQFGIGIAFGFGQFIASTVAIAQFALGIYFGLGQFATGITAIGQFAFGRYVLAQAGYGEHVWSVKARDPEAVEYFHSLWEATKFNFQRIKNMMGG